MITKLHSLAAVAVASVLLVAACGGSSGPAKTPPSKPKTSTTPKKTTPPASTSTGSTGPTASTAPTASTSPASSTSVSAAESAALKAAGTTCHSEYAALSSQIGGGAAGDLQGICTAFSTGSLASVRAAIAKFCTSDLGSVPSQYQAALQTGCQSYKKAFGG